MRVAPAARRADPQRPPQVRLPRPGAARSRTPRTAWTGGYAARRADRRPAEERRGRLRRRRPRRSTRSRREGRVVVRYVGDNPNGSLPRHRRDLQRARQRRRADAAPGARGRGAHRPGHRRPRRSSPRVLDRRRGMTRHPTQIDTVTDAAATPDARAAVRRARPQGRRVRPDPRDPRPPPDRRRAGDVLGHVERALLLQVVARCTCASSATRPRRPTRCWSASARTPASSTSARAGRSPSRSSRTTTRRYVEPYQGAATGVGGIVRDILSMGARPVAVMDPLRFGPADAPDTAPGAARRRRRHRRLRQLPRACPTSAARSSSTRPTPATRWSTRCASACCGTRTSSSPTRRGAGNQVILFGARDRRRRHRRGLGAGVARRSPTSGPTKRPSVQVGDPFTEKVLIECCLELFAADLVVGIQDLGGAGLSCATSELASPTATAACTSGSTGCRCATPSLRARGDPDERVAGADVAVVEPGQASTRSSAICAQVGRRSPP